MKRTTPLVAAALLATIASPIAAQECAGDSWNGRRARFCEVREYSFAAGPSLQVGGSPNGSVEVIGSAGDEVRVLARVQANAGSEAEAREIAAQIDVEAGGDRVMARGPSLRGVRNVGWSVSWTIHVPHGIDLDLDTVNGSISVADVIGAVDARTTNGAITLDDVAGRVTAHTTNGAVEVRLAGTPWQGESLEVRTTNGSVALAVPDGFGADLSVRTVNGGIETDFPVMVHGRIGRRSLDATIGEGGPPVRLETTNGGVEIRRR